VRVAHALFTDAVKLNNVAAQIWWTKARMGWKEATDLNVGGGNKGRPSAPNMECWRAVRRSRAGSDDEVRGVKRFRSRLLYTLLLSSVSERGMR
jgi:hypothetical protein